MGDNSCTTAILSNYGTRIANFDSDISKRMNILTTMKSFKIAYFNSKGPNGSLVRDIQSINSKYDQGRYIQASYTDIPQDALQDNVINSDFFNNNIVIDGAIHKCDGGPAVYCADSGDMTDRRCCECGKNTGCNTDNIWTPWRSGCQGDGYDCNAPLNYNMFEKYKQNELTNLRNSVENNLTSLERAWAIAYSTPSNNQPPAPITCCQSINFGNITAQSATLSDVKNVC